jgi:uncharacterized caspase-like protein
VGINNYRHYQKLEGAVRDATDIAAVLEKAGARRVIRLLDDQATKKRIRQAWDSLVDGAKKGDTIVFSYAGHGGQEPEAVKGSEKDGKDEAFLLGHFNPETLHGQTQRIVDNELNLWLRRAGKRGIRVVFVADSCHSGTVTRKVDFRTQPTSRLVPPYKIPHEPYAPAMPDMDEAAWITGQDLSHVTFFAAAEDHQKIYELPLGGHKRGVLSWAFARALENRADRNNDHILTRAELESYILPAVEQLSESRQKPDVRPRSGEKGVDSNAPLIELRGKGLERVLPGQDGKVLPARKLRIRMLHTSQDRQQELANTLEGIILAKAGEAADLVWDNTTKEVLSSPGDIVAENIRARDLQQVLDKWRILPGLKQLALARTLPVTLSPGDSRHETGDLLSFHSANPGFPFLTLLNLPPEGGHELLYPLKESERGRAISGKPFVLRLQVKPPYGVDHLVLVASQKPLYTLHWQFVASSQEKTGNRGNKNILDSITRALAGTPYSIGIKGLYTHAKK